MWYVFMIIYSNLTLKQNNKVEQSETVLSGADTKQKTTTHKTQVGKNDKTATSD